MASRVFSRASRSSICHRLICASPRQEPLRNLSSSFNSLSESKTSSSFKWVPCQMTWRHSSPTNAIVQRFGFSSSASPQPTEKEANQFADVDNASQKVSQDGTNTESTKTRSDSKMSEQIEGAGSSIESKDPKTSKRRRSTRRTTFSDSDTESELSIDDLVKLVAEKEGLLKLKHKQIEEMQEKVLRSYAEMENVIERTKREAENSKKFAIQNFAKSLLDVADNLERASSVVKESLSKIKSSEDSSGALRLLKTLLEGVEMTEKQLAEVYRKFGVERFDPTTEPFDPHRHHAVFKIPDASKPPGTVAVVLKPGYMLYDRVLRPAEVGVTEALNGETDQSSGA